MFSPKTAKIAGIAKNYPKVITELEFLFQGKVGMYIDFANVRPWSEKLQWHIALPRLKQFFDSFDNVDDIRLYSGTLQGDLRSEKDIQDAKDLHFTVRTKPVKIMRLSVDATSLSSSADISLLKQFISKSFLRQVTVQTIEYLNQQLISLNKTGVLSIEDRKCNFDVEIGTDMLLADAAGKTDTFVLWSGDSDFHDTILQLLHNKKKVLLFATSGRVSRELNDLRSEGLLIFDIQKIRDFICWNREMLVAPKP